MVEEKARNISYDFPRIVITPMMTINQIMQLFPKSSDVFKAFDVSIENDGKYQLTKLESRDDLDLKGLVLTLNNLFGKGGNIVPVPEILWNACDVMMDYIKAGKGRSLPMIAVHAIRLLPKVPPEDLLNVPLQEQPFRHLVDMGMDVSEYKCSMCHTGTSGF